MSLAEQTKEWHIRLYRLGITQKDFAKMCGLNYQHFNAVVNGRGSTTNTVDFVEARLKELEEQSK